MEMKTPGTALSCGARCVLIFMHIYLCLASRLGCVLQSVEAESVVQGMHSRSFRGRTLWESRQDQLKMADYWNRLFAG